MTIEHLLNRTATITHRVADDDGPADAFNNRTPGSDSAEVPCDLQQRRRDEDDARGEIAHDEWLLVVPAGTAIAAADTVTVDDVDYEVHGEPWRVRPPWGTVDAHIEATLRRAGGSPSGGGS